MLPNELQHVHQVYDEIAHDFDRTRYALWPRVVSFLQGLPFGSKILDIGCGNGKYLSVRAGDCEVHACDPCAALVAIAQRKHPNATVLEANGLSLPYEDDVFDGVMSVAVLHHLVSVEKRIAFLQDMIRVLRPGGKGHVTVWAAHQEEACRKRWVSLGANDYMVPWTLSGTGKVLQRFYHVFTREEIQDLVGNACEAIAIMDITLEKGNWHITFYKQAAPLSSVA